MSFPFFFFSLLPFCPPLFGFAKYNHNFESLLWAPCPKYHLFYLFHLFPARPAGVLKRRRDGDVNGDARRDGRDAPSLLYGTAAPKRRREPRTERHDGENPRQMYLIFTENPLPGTEKARDSFKPYSPRPAASRPREFRGSSASFKPILAPGCNFR